MKPATFADPDLDTLDDMDDDDLESALKAIDIESEKNAASKTLSKPKERVPTKLSETTLQMFLDLPLSAQALVAAQDVLDCALGLEGTLVRLKRNPAAVTEADPTSPQYGFCMPENHNSAILSLAENGLHGGSIYLMLKDQLPKLSSQDHTADACPNAWSSACLSVPVAVASSLDELLQDYVFMVGSLETKVRTGHISIHSLLLALEKPFRILGLLAQVAGLFLGDMTVNHIACLDRIALMMETEREPEFRNILEHISLRAITPIEIRVNLWLEFGILLNDPHRDFFIQSLVSAYSSSSSSSSLSDYNILDIEDRDMYHVDRDRVPHCFKYSNMPEMILEAGKFAKMIRKSGKSELGVHNRNNTPGLVSTSPTMADGTPPPPPLNSHDLIQFHFQAQHVLEHQMRKWLNYNSHRVLMGMKNHNGLMPTLQKLKMVFLIDRSDLFDTFLDVAHNELVKNAKNVKIHKVQTALDLAYGMNPMSSTMHPTIQCGISHYSFVEQMEKITRYTNLGAMAGTRALAAGAGGGGGGGGGKKQGQDEDEDSGVRSGQDVARSGYDCLVLHYEAPWPLHVIFPPQVISKYQLLFRAFLHFKRAERVLLSAWQMTRGVSVRFTKQPVWLQSAVLRQRMIQYVQNMLQYMMVEVVQHHWEVCESSVMEASTVEQVVAAVDDFVSTCVKECMLSNRRLTKLLTSLSDLCVLFSAYLGRLVDDGVDENVDGENDDEESSTSSTAHVQKFEQNFNAYFCRLIDALNTSSLLEADPHMMQLCTRLDFNGYYRSHSQTSETLGLSLDHTTLERDGEQTRQETGPR